MLRDLLDDELLACPACRGMRDGVFVDHPLFLLPGSVERDGEVIHGFLGCRGCPARYPVIDGVAIVFADVPDQIRQQERALLWRDDLPDALHAWLLTAWDDDQDPSWRRQMLAIYGGTLDDPPDAGDPFSEALHEQIRASRAFVEGRQRARIEALGERPLVVDVGAAVGASSLSMARHGARVIAVDSDIGPLRLLARLARDGRVDAPRWRHGGDDYVPARLTRQGPRPDVTPIAADALDPPLRAASIDLVTCYNVLDNVSDPALLVRQLHATLRPGGGFVCSSPYDWVSRCTPRDRRLGHQLGPRTGDAPPDPAAALRALLTGGLPDLAPELAFEIAHERDALPWILRRHDRSYHVFLTHYVEALKPAR